MTQGPFTPGNPPAPDHAWERLRQFEESRGYPPPVQPWEKQAEPEPPPQPSPEPEPETAE